MHMGQRDTIWLRIRRKRATPGSASSTSARLLHKLQERFPGHRGQGAGDAVHRLRRRGEASTRAAAAAYQQRDDRMAALTDESVDIFYSCPLCQSFAPNHVCIITPERLGLCGAYNWLDGKAAYEINPHRRQPAGAQRRQSSTRCWASGRASTISSSNASNGAFERFSAYSMINDPMTSCGCFECIACVLPRTGGIMIVTAIIQGRPPSA